MSTATASFAPPLPSTENASVLVASGNSGFRQQMLDLLGAARHHGVEALGGADALLKLELGPCAGLVLDRQLPDLDPDELAGMVSSQYPALEIEMLDSAAAPLRRLTQTGPMDFRSLMDALRAAPHQAWPTPRPAPPLALPARRHTSPDLADAQAEDADEAGPLAPVALLPGLVGRSTHLSDLSNLVRMVAPRRTTVLLLGETGTGKELVAHGIHHCSSRAQRPWVVVNCAAIPEALLESELFGYVRGAFTGAMQSRPGRIVTAHTGTLFLDEIGELPLALQAKLLRFLQEGELQRLGSNEPQRVDVRVVAATNVDLLAQVEAGRFRRDLYYRLAVFPIELLPLHQRTADVLPLARHFLKLLHAEAGLPLPSLSAAATELLQAYPWPGNVRELQHALERAFILAGGQSEIKPTHFPTLQSWRQAQVKQ